MFLHLVPDTEARTPACPGCRERPARECAACGRPAVVATDAGPVECEGDEPCSVSWCGACYAELRRLRPRSRKHPPPPLVEVWRKPPPGATPRRRKRKERAA